MRLFHNAYMPGMAVLLWAGMCLYFERIAIPFERQSYAEIGQPANVGDLYPSWYGTRELLLHGRDPYSSTIAGEIQTTYFGHALDFNRPADRGKDDQRFYYPLYVVFFLAPTVGMPFPTVQILARFGLTLATAASLLLWLRASRRSLAWPSVVTLLLLLLSSPPFAQGIELQQMALLVAFFLASCVALVTSGSLIWAGCFLALATLKPQMALVPILWLSIWVVGDWRRRQRLVWGFVVSMAALLGASQWLSPGWLGRFVSGVHAYPHHRVMDSLLDFYLTPAIATPVRIIALAAVLFAGFRGRREAADSDGFFARFSLALVVAVLVLPTLLPPFNQILLLPGVLLVLRNWGELSDGGRVAKTICILSAVAFFWPWLVAPIMLFAHRLAPGEPLANFWLSPLAMSFSAPPLLLVLLLIWMSKKRAFAVGGGIA